MTDTSSKDQVRRTEPFGDLEMAGSKSFMLPGPRNGHQSRTGDMLVGGKGSVSALHFKNSGGFGSSFGIGNQKKAVSRLSGLRTTTLAPRLEADQQGKSGLNTRNNSRLARTPLKRKSDLANITDWTDQQLGHFDDEGATVRDGEGVADGTIYELPRVDKVPSAIARPVKRKERTQRQHHHQHLQLQPKENPSAGDEFDTTVKPHLNFTPWPVPWMCCKYKSQQMERRFMHFYYSEGRSLLFLGVVIVWMIVWLLASFYMPSHGWYVSSSILGTGTLCCCIELYLNYRYRPLRRRPARPAHNPTERRSVCRSPAPMSSEPAAEGQADVQHSWSILVPRQAPKPQPVARKPERWLALVQRVLAIPSGRGITWQLQAVHDAHREVAKAQALLVSDEIAARQGADVSKSAQGSVRRPQLTGDPHLMGTMNPNEVSGQAIGSRALGKSLASLKNKAARLLLFGTRARRGSDNSSNEEADSQSELLPTFAIWCYELNATLFMVALGAIFSTQVTFLLSCDYSLNHYFTPIIDHDVAQADVEAFCRWSIGSHLLPPISFCLLTGRPKHWVSFVVIMASTAASIIFTAVTQDTYSDIKPQSLYQASQNVLVAALAIVSALGFRQMLERAQRHRFEQRVIRQLKVWWLAEEKRALKHYVDGLLPPSVRSRLIHGKVLAGVGLQSTDEADSNGEGGEGGPPTTADGGGLAMDPIIGDRDVALPQPKPVMDIPNKRNAIRDYTPCGTVTAIDIYDFVPFCQQHMPGESVVIVAMLHSQLKAAAAKCKLDHTYTFGDTFVAVANLFHQQEMHASLSVQFVHEVFAALYPTPVEPLPVVPSVPAVGSSTEMIEVIYPMGFEPSEAVEGHHEEMVAIREEVPQPAPPPPPPPQQAMPQVRVAMHSGPLSGGVVGNAHLRYAIFGPTVWAATEGIIGLCGVDECFVMISESTIRCLGTGARVHDASPLALEMDPLLMPPIPLLLQRMAPEGGTEEDISYSTLYVFTCVELFSSAELAAVMGIDDGSPYYHDPLSPTQNHVHTGDEDSKSLVSVSSVVSVDRDSLSSGSTSDEEGGGLSVKRTRSHVRGYGLNGNATDTEAVIGHHLQEEEAIATELREMRADAIVPEQVSPELTAKILTRQREGALKQTGGKIWLLRTDNRFVNEQISRAFFIYNYVHAQYYPHLMANVIALFLVLFCLVVIIVEPGGIYHIMRYNDASGHKYDCGDPSGVQCEFQTPFDGNIGRYLSFAFFLSSLLFILISMVIQWNVRWYVVKALSALDPLQQNPISSNSPAGLGASTSMNSNKGKYEKTNFWAFLLMPSLRANEGLPHFEAALRHDFGQILSTFAYIVINIDRFVLPYLIVSMALFAGPLSRPSIIGNSTIFILEVLVVYLLFSPAPAWAAIVNFAFIFFIYLLSVGVVHGVSRWAFIITTSANVLAAAVVSLGSTNYTMGTFAHFLSLVLHKEALDAHREVRKAVLAATVPAPLQEEFTKLRSAISGERLFRGEAAIGTILVQDMILVEVRTNALRSPAMMSVLKDGDESATGVAVSLLTLCQRQTEKALSIANKRTADVVAQKHLETRGSYNRGAAKKRNWLTIIRLVGDSATIAGPIAADEPQSQRDEVVLCLVVFLRTLAILQKQRRKGKRRLTAQVQQPTTTQSNSQTFMSVYGNNPTATSSSTDLTDITQGRSGRGILLAELGTSPPSLGISPTTATGPTWAAGESSHFDPPSSLSAKAAAQQPFVFTAAAVCDLGITVMHNSLYPSFDILGNAAYRGSLLIKAAPHGAFVVTEAIAKVYRYSHLVSLAIRMESDRIAGLKQLIKDKDSANKRTAKRRGNQALDVQTDTDNNNTTGGGNISPTHTSSDKNSDPFADISSVVDSSKTTAYPAPIQYPTIIADTCQNAADTIFEPAALWRVKGLGCVAVHQLKGTRTERIK